MRKIYFISIGFISLFVYLLIPESKKSSLDKPKPIISDTTLVLTYMPSINDTTDTSDFNLHRSEYFYEQPMEFVWNAYTQFNPFEIWKGPINNIAINYSEEDNDFNPPFIKENNIILLKIHFYKKIEFFALLKVVNINSDTKEIELCYGNSGVAKGNQKLFFTNEDGLVKVEHITMYKSERKFRDKFLYPFFHKKSIDEFHAFMLLKLNSLQEVQDTIVL